MAIVKTWVMILTEEKKKKEKKVLIFNEPNTKDFYKNRS